MSLGLERWAPASLGGDRHAPSYSYMCSDRRQVELVSVHHETLYCSKRFLAPVGSA